jgi:hypothetical protein
VNRRKIIPKFRWTDLFRKLKCDDYNKEAKEMTEGANCFSLLVNYLALTGHKISFEDELVNDYTFQNVVYKWEKNDTAAVNMAREYFKDVVHRVPVDRSKIGDIVIVTDHRNKLFPCINAGNGRLFTMTEKGTVFLKIAQVTVVDAYRPNKFGGLL